MELKWSAPEYEHYEKGTSWHWLIVIAAILIGIFSLWRGNFLFAIFVILAATMLTFWGRRFPKRLEFKLDQAGLEIVGHKSYSYEDFKGFALRSGELILQKKNRLSHFLKIRIPENAQEKFRIFLGKRLPEVEYEESLVEHIAKLLRF